MADILSTIDLPNNNDNNNNNSSNNNNNNNNNEKIVFPKVLFRKRKSFSFPKTSAEEKNILKKSLEASNIKILSKNICVISNIIVENQTISKNN